MSSTALLTLTAAGAALVWIAVYTGLCWFLPFKVCKPCHGIGRVIGPTGRKGRRCRRCNGHGRYVRLGRRLWNWLGAEHAAGTDHHHRRTTTASRMKETSR